MEKSLNWYEFVITRLIKASGYSAIIFVALIFFFLVREGVPHRHLELELLAGAVRPVDRLAVLHALEGGADEGTALARLHVLEVHDLEQALGKAREG